METIHTSLSTAPNDWFHNNACAYRSSDNSLIVSSRENFVIALDYDSGIIKWILGDPTKHWYQFPSLRQFSLTMTPGTLPPIGQHAVSTPGDDLLLFDDGTGSELQQPPGETRDYSAPRKYHLDLRALEATETWHYYPDPSVYSPFCSSVYEDAPDNYVIDYSRVALISIPASLISMPWVMSLLTINMRYGNFVVRLGTRFRSTGTI